MDDKYTPRGGVRPGAGRKPMFGGRLRDTTMTLTPEMTDRLREFGNGNTSAGVRELLVRYERMVELCRTGQTFAVDLLELRGALEEWGEVAALDADTQPAMSRASAVDRGYGG